MTSASCTRLIVLVGAVNVVTVLFALGGDGTVSDLIVPSSGGGTSR